jgi:hypothetical protein
MCGISRYKACYTNSRRVFIIELGLRRVFSGSDNGRARANAGKSVHFNYMQLNTRVFSGTENDAGERGRTRAKFEISKYLSFCVRLDAFRCVDGINGGIRHVFPCFYIFRLSTTFLIYLNVDFCEIKLYIL